jgi:hypothetical protein
MRHDETLSKDKVETVSSSWLNENEAWHNVATSAGGEVAPGRGNGGDDASWADVNLTEPKNKENPRG